MASPNGHADARLSPRAFARAEFFQAVRAILAVSRAGLGDDTRAEAEPIRFRVSDGMRHPDAEIVAIDRPDDAGMVEITVGHIGLTGAMGVMPDHYSDLIMERRRARDESLARFLDLFNHRTISLFYRAWAKYRLPVRFEEAGGGFEDPFSQALASLCGMARLKDPGLLAAAGPLARPVRSAGSLRRIVSALFNLPVTIEELHPRRIRIGLADRTRLGSGGHPRGSFAALGRDIVLGETTIDAGGRFRLRLGPLAWPEFAAFFEPDGIRRRLVEAVRFAVGGTIDFDLQLVLMADAVPQAVLDRRMPPRLSQTAWLLAGPSSSDRPDAILPGTAAGGSLR